MHRRYIILTILIDWIPVRGISFTLLKAITWQANPLCARGTFASLSINKEPLQLATGVAHVCLRCICFTI